MKDIGLKKNTVKMNWIPEKGEWYISYNNLMGITWYVWDDKLIDCMRLKLGLVFKSAEIAIKKRPKIFKALTGKEWSDNND